MQPYAVLGENREVTGFVELELDQKPDDPDTHIKIYGSSPPIGYVWNGRYFEPPQQKKR